MENSTNSRRSLLKTVAAGGMLAAIGGGCRRDEPHGLSQPEDKDGVRWIRLANGHRVWTQRLGRGPKKVLLLHGGPGFSHDYLECFADFLPPAGFEIYFYDQLGCGRSDRPADPALWTVDRYRGEVEEVRIALGLKRFILYGHSWGGLLGIEYALAHQRNLDAFVLSNMTASIADYVRYTAMLRASLPLSVRNRLDALEAAGKAAGPEFAAIVEEELYTRYICRLKPWPDGFVRSVKGLNADIYNRMQGANEFSVTGTLRSWNRWADLRKIVVPTLVMGARYDEMDPASIRREDELLPRSRLFISESGSHLSMWDDQNRYFAALLDFLHRL